MNNKIIKTLLIIIVAFIVPVILILTNIISFDYRFYVLEISTIILFLYTRLTQISLNKLGFTTKNLKPSLIQLLPLTLGLSIFMLITYSLGWVRLPENFTITWKFYLFFVFISSPSQEFLYRGFLFWLFEDINIIPRNRIILSSVLYSFVHAIYWDLPTLIITLVIGLIWGQNYEKYRNLYSVIFSHSVLGAVAIMVGLI